VPDELKDIMPKTEEERLEQEAAAIKLQAIAKGRNARRTKAEIKPKAGIAPVVMTNAHGCTLWDVPLRKREGKLKYGMSYVNGKSEFLKERAGLQSPEDAAPETLYIKKVAPGGLLEEWNEEHPDGEVKVSDRIVAVNGFSTVSEMKSELRRDEITVRISRYAVSWKVELCRREDAKKLGFKFVPPSNENLPELRITEVSPTGLMEEWNKFNMRRGLFHYVVLNGMRIEQVNNVEGKGPVIAEELRRKDVDTFTIQVKRTDVAATAKLKVQQKMKLLKAFGGGGKKNPFGK
jgi:hypothetical protein